MGEEPRAGRPLAEVRAAIDRVDGEILRLLNDRARLAAEVGRVKRQEGAASFYVPEREEDLVRRLRARNPGPFPDGAIRAVWREIMSASLSLEQPLEAAYLGPAATFTHQACLKQFGFSARHRPVRTIAEVFDAVEKGKAQYGVVPVENTTEGVVSYTLDMFLRSELKVVGEVLLRVTHNLLSRSGQARDVAEVHSHPQALAQCRRWLEAHFPDVPTLEAPSTARAAELAAEDPRVAAVAGEVAARLYGLRTVEARIEDNPNNFTRFLVVGREIPGPSGRDKTAVLFVVKDEVGALHRMLEPFAREGVSLTKIESRPLKDRAWEYAFFVDCVGHRDDEPVRRALEGLEAQCKLLRVLGSYPRADTAE